MPRLTLQLICDDVRVENNGKLIIIGLYVDAVVVSGFPANLLLTFVQIYQVEELGQFLVNLQLSGPNGNIGEPIPIEFAPRSLGAVVGIAKVPIRFESSGEYQITITDSNGSVVPNPGGAQSKTFAILQVAAGGGQ